MIEAKIVCDSLAPSGHRLTTYVLTYPRFIHAEFMTHRMISRNASSSRAIPVKRQIEMIETNPAIPIAFRKNQKGMQAGEVLENQDEAVRLWLKGRDEAVGIAKSLASLEVHKQYANRVLEPYAHITVIASATEWQNFFALRCHSAAQPEINMLAMLMWEAYSLETPKEVEGGYWHLPLLSDDDIDACCVKYGVSCLKDSEDALDLAIKRSTAKCARVSYLNHDGTSSTIEQDLELYERLLGGVPIHASPAEHQACAMFEPARSGNFLGWIQHRKLLENENITVFKGPES